MYEAVYGAIYVDGEYSINEEPLYDKTTRYFIQDKLDDFLVITINNKAINNMFENFTKMIDDLYYSDKDSNALISKQALKTINVDFSLLLSNPGEYTGSIIEEDKELNIKNTLVLLKNNIKKKYFYVALSTGEGKYDFDRDKWIRVNYDKLLNIEKYIKLSADCQKIKLKGKLKTIYDFEEDKYYLEATKITFKKK